MVRSAFRVIRPVILVLCIAIGTADTRAYALPSSAAQEYQREQTTAVHIVTQTHPAARVRREGWSSASRLSLGARVYHGDRIEPGGESVWILCANLTEQLVLEQSAVPCRHDQGRQYFEHGEQVVAGWQRGAREDIGLPYLIVPRATSLSTTLPLIRWNRVFGADGYQVSIRGDSVLWSQEIDDGNAHELLYPEDGPPLVPGAAYTVEVSEITAGMEGRSSSEEGATGLSFQVLTTDEVERINTAVEDIQHSVSNGDASAIIVVIAYYYAQENLNAEAIQTLEMLTSDLMDPEESQARIAGNSPVVYLLLGDLYLKTQLELYATIAYQYAWESAKQNDDLESQALALVGLARLAINETEQNQYASEALMLYQTLGAQAEMEEIRIEFGLYD